jgi:hypothetical protein
MAGMGEQRAGVGSLEAHLQEVSRLLQASSLIQQRADQLFAATPEQGLYALLLQVGTISDTYSMIVVEVVGLPAFVFVLFFCPTARFPDFSGSIAKKQIQYQVRSARPHFPTPFLWPY